MIELRTLGLVDLRDAAGAEIRSVLQQPKRLALLVYLTLSSPRRYHRRDSLLAMFWPELDDEHARAALRRSLYYLRTGLGAEVIKGRGEEEICVAPEELWCDAAEFAEALRAEQLERALELYRGDLLEGLHVSGAPAFQDWLDRERGRLRDAAARAAWSLADAAEEKGQERLASQWGQRAFELTPDDEDVLRRLLRLLDRVGERGAALRVYEEYSRRVTLEYDLEPEDGTRTLIEAIRTRPAPSRPEGAGARTAPEQSSVPADPGVLGVFPFAVRGSDRLAYLAEGMVHLLSTTLEGAGEFRIVDPRALLAAIPKQSSAELPIEQAREVAASLGAGLLLLGSVVEAGGRLQATATLYGSGGAPRVSVQSHAESEAKLFEMVEQLSRELLAELHPGPAMRIARTAARMTDSPVALKCYLQGERCLRAGRYFDAMEPLQRAVREDPTFALAYYRLAGAAAGSALPDLARETIERGYQHRHRLAEHDRLLLDAARAWLLGEVTNAESLYNAITASYPDDVEAWFHLGDMLFHSNPLRGRSAAESRGAFERVLSYDPEHVASLVHLMRVAAIEGRQDEALDLSRRVQGLSPGGDQALAHEAFVAFAERDEAAIERVLGALQRARAVTVGVAFSDVAIYSGNPDGADRIGRAFLEVARSAELRALIHVGLAHAALSQGRWEAALMELARAEPLDYVQAIETRALFAALPFLPVDPTEVAEVRELLEGWDATGVAPSSFPPLAAHNGLHPSIKSYLSGLLALRSGDLAGARDALARLSGRSETDESARRASLRRSLSAALTRAERGPVEALAALGRPQIDLWFQVTVTSPFLSLAYERFLRAELLYEMGRDAEALGWFGAIAQRSPYELIYAAPAHLRRAEIFARQGDRTAAEAEYERLRARWMGADPELQPQLHHRCSIR
ncbi:MAG TPA: BTAD domain-containing putative transcriptional regulator [Gemmatimonadales bacterium]|nr:BTAD domain-containing putative transcriptional regulator [Gemmatimonadales bacterium]